MASRLVTTIELLHTAAEGALASHSVALPGYPFVSAIPFVAEASHRPVFLMSQLAEHTQNLAANPHASLLLRKADGQPAHASLRITLVGRVVPVEDTEPLRRRYLRYLPEADRYLQLGDFSFHRFDIERARIIAGFGQATWLDGDRLLEAASIGLEAEAAVLEQVAAHAPLELAGFDPYGLDYRREGVPGREPFETAPVTRDAAAAAIRRAVERLSRLS